MLESLRKFGSFVLEGEQNLPTGVAFFASTSFSGWFPLPERIRGAVFVSSSFHIRPLLPYLNPSTRWHALVIGDEATSLFRCSADSGELIARCSTGANRIRAGSAATEKLEQWARTRLTVSSEAPLVLTAPHDVRSQLAGLKVMSIIRRLFVGTDGVIHGDVSAPAKLWSEVKPFLQSHADCLLLDLRKEFALGRAITRPEDVIARLHKGGLRALAISEEGQMRGRIDWRSGAMRRDTVTNGYGDCVLDDILERALRKQCRIVQAGARDLPPGALLLAV